MPTVASRNYDFFRKRELPQSKPDGFDSSLGEGASGVTGRFAVWMESFCLPSACKDAPLGQRQGGVFRLPPPYLWTPLSPQRVKGCSPLTIPKMRSKPKNASRFAKRIFLCFSHLRLRRRFHLSAELHALRKRNTSCEAASRRNEKKAFSEAASFFPFRQLLRGLKGASSPFLVPPAPRK